MLDREIVNMNMHTGLISVKNEDSSISLGHLMVQENNSVYFRPVELIKPPEKKQDEKR